MSIAAVCTLALFAASAPAANIPRQAKDLKIQMPGGKTLPLNSFRGKVVALEFLLTTCPHCQQASVIMDRLQKEYGPKGFQALGASIRPGPPTVEDYVKQHSISYPVGSVTAELAHDFLQHPTTTAMMMPQLVFIDRTGVIRAQFAGNDPFFEAGAEEQNMRKWIETLLKPGGAKKGAKKKKTS